MQHIIGVTELQRRFHSIFNRVVQDRVPYVLTRGSRPEAVLLAYEDFLRFQEWQERAALPHFDRLLERLAVQNAAISDEEIADDVAAARAELSTVESAA